MTPLKAESSSATLSQTSTPTPYLPQNIVVNCVGALAFGTIGNSVVGALTGLLGSLIWQHNSQVLKGIMLIGSLSGGIGGLLHALVIINVSKMVKGNTTDGLGASFGGVCAQVFSEAPCWSAIGASIGFWTTRNLTSDISFPVVIFTALAGTLGLAIYTMVTCRLTGSYLHLFILQNQVLLLAERFNIWVNSPDRLSQSPKPYYPFMPEFESSLTKTKQICIDIEE